MSSSHWLEGERTSHIILTIMVKQLSDKQRNYLDKIFTNPSIQGGGFGSVSTLFHAISKDKNRLEIKKDQLIKFLEGKPSYTQNRKRLVHFKTRKIFVGGLNQLHQADLIDFSKFKKFNNNITFLLIVEDVFSKYIWVEPLKNKENKSILEAFEKIYPNDKDFPSVLTTDKGTEFTGKTVQKFFHDHDVNFYSSHGNTKAQFVERVIRTFKKKIFQLFSERSSYKYIDKLQDLVQNYNHSFNRTTETFPANVTSKNQEQIFFNLYESIGQIGKDSLASKKQLKQNKIQTNDFVRIQIDKGIFSKKYNDTFSGEIFQVRQIIKSNPLAFKIDDLLGEDILGKFYSDELQKIDMKYEKFIIRKILKKLKNGDEMFYKVEWVNYGDKFNSIISSENIIKM